MILVIQPFYVLNVIFGVIGVGETADLPQNI